MASQNDHAKVAAGASITAAIAAAMAWLNSRKVAAGESIIPEEVVQLIVALAASSEEIKAGIQTIIQQLASGGGGGGAGWPANTDSLTALRVAVAVAGTQMPFIAVPSGLALVVKAWTLNPGWLQVGASQAECTQLNQSFPLLPNEVVTYQVQNANQIYIAGTVAGCFACLTVEQRRVGGG
jgi:hypothetical protein